MTRIARNISDIGVICCFFYGQRIARITRISFSCHLMNQMNLTAGAMYSLKIRAFRGVRWQNNYQLWNKLLSPESKTYELL